jgi:hypothetical protein
MKKIKLLFAAFAAMVGLGAYAQTWTGNAVANGTFYLYNVGAQKFLNNGDPLQDWGTNAYLQAGFGMDVIIAEADGGYTIDTNISNGGDSHYLGNSTWCDANPISWQFKAVDGETNTYQIMYGGQYLMANEGLNDVEMVGDPGTRTTSTYWKLVSEDDFKDAMEAKVYSANDPMDVSVFIKGRSFARNDGRNNTWVRTSSGGNVQWIEGYNNKYWGNEFYGNTFDIHQTITGLPDGTYEVQCSGFGTNGTTFIYGNTKEGALTSENSAAGGSRTTAYRLIADENAWAGQTTGTFTLSGGELTVGLKRSVNSGWTVYDEFRLYYYGLDLSEFAATLATAVSEAEAFDGTTIPAAAYDALVAVVTEQNKSYTSAAEYTAAAEAIANATNTAKAMVAPYAAYKLIPANATFAGVDEETINAQNAAVEKATTVEAIEACSAALQSAIDALAFDITSFTITNASPYANGDGWTATNGNRLSEWASNPVTYDSSNKNAEMWNNTGASMLYTIKDLPAGNYRLTAIAGTRTNSGSVLKVGDKTIDLVSVGSLNDRTAVGKWFDEGNGVNELFFSLDAAAEELTIGLVAGTSGDAWTLWRSFKLDTFDENIALDYLTPGYAPLVEAAQATLADEAYKNVTGEEKTALETAIAATPSTVAEYEAAVLALNNAVNAFKAAKTNYDIFAKERALADAISTDIVVAAPTTAENALVQFRALKVAEFNYVAEEYPYSATSKIGEFSTWDRIGIVNGESKGFTALTEQHWSGTKMTYYEQPAGGWSSNANTTWSANYTKTTTLPAGTYVIKVAARAASGSNTVAKITCSAATVEGPIFNFGDTGKGITTAGAASFDEGTFCNNGNGRGWVWNYLPFTLDAETEVTMTVVAEAKGQYQWFSVCDGELLSKTNIATAVAYDEEEDNTIKDVDVANVTMTRNIKEGFNTVVLPFDLTANQVQTAFGSGTEVYEFSEGGEENAEYITISFNKVVAGTISANVPVLVKATEASTEQVFNGVQVKAPAEGAIVKGKNASFVGVFSPTTIGTGHFFIGNGALYKSAGATNINAFRAYIQLAHPNVPNNVRMFVDGEETETGIENVNVSDNDNQAVIYNVAGQRISKMQKGINIVNGKKVLK